MKGRNTIAIVYILIALLLSLIFYLKIEFPNSLEKYFKKEYYSQFGPIAICIELLIAGYYLFKGHTKANFYLALFGFTALLDMILNLLGIFSSGVPIYGTVIFLCCAIFSLWLAFSNAFNLGRISIIATLGSFALGSLVELFFNNL